MGSSSVVELVLTNNTISQLSNQSLSSLPPSLRLLALDGNQLKELSVDALAVLDSRVKSGLRHLESIYTLFCRCTVYCKVYSLLYYTIHTVV